MRENCQNCSCLKAKKSLNEFGVIYRGDMYRFYHGGICGFYLSGICGFCLCVC